MKDWIRTNFILLSILYTLIVGPLLFYKITFWYGGGYGLWAVFVTLPLAILITPTFIVLTLLYVFLWAKEDKTSLLIYNIIIFLILMITGVVIIDNKIENKPITNILTKKKGFYGKAYNSNTHRDVKYYIPQKYDDIKLIFNGIDLDKICSFLEVKHNGKTEYIDHKNNIMFSEYDNVYVANEITYNRFGYKNNRFVVEKNGKYGVDKINSNQCRTIKEEIPILYDKIFFDKIEIKRNYNTPISFIIAHRNNLIDVYIAKDDAYGNSEHKLIYKDLKRFSINKKEHNNEKILVKIDDVGKYIKQSSSPYSKEERRKMLLRNNNIVEREIKDDYIKVYVNNDVQYIGDKLLRKQNKRSMIYYEIKYD